MTDNQLQEFEDWLDKCPFDAYSRGNSVPKQNTPDGWVHIYDVDVFVPE